MNEILIAVGIIFAIGFFVGIARGFIKLMISLLATVITIILIVFLTPYISSAIYKYTPIDDMIRDKCEEAMIPSLEKLDLSGVEVGGVDLGMLGEIDLGGLKEIGKEKFGINDEDIMSVLKSVEIPKDVQSSMVEKSNLPGFFKQGLLDNNNKEVYKELGVKNFPDYVGAYLAKIVVSVVAFLVTFLLAIVIVKIIIYALAIMEELPLVHGLNRLAGGAAGLVMALVVVWIGFMVVTLLYDTKFGIQCFEGIGKSNILTLLYDWNPILKWFSVLR